MKESIILLGLSMSVLTNCYSLWRLLKALKENDSLAARLSMMEWAIRDLTLLRK